LKSGKTLKEFRGHTSFVNSVLFSKDNTRVLSASSDGTVKIWDTKTTSSLYSVIPQMETATTLKTAAAALNPIGGLGSQSVQQIIPLPKHVDQFVVCNKSDVLYIMTIRGHFIKAFTRVPADTKTASSNVGFVAAATSPNGQYVYGVDEDSVLYCYQTNNGALVHQGKVNQAEVTGMAGHPLSNVLVLYDATGFVYFLRP
jgi:WD40 repeat-containing protein SMU1